MSQQPESLNIEPAGTREPGSIHIECSGCGELLFSGPERAIWTISEILATRCVTCGYCNEVTRLVEAPSMPETAVVVTMEQTALYVNGERKFQSNKVTETQLKGILVALGLKGERIFYDPPGIHKDSALPVLLERVKREKAEGRA